MPIKTSPLKAIKAKCLDCSGGKKSEIRNCNIEHCPLFLFRFGRKPKLPERRGRKLINLNLDTTIDADIGKLVKEEYIRKEGVSDIVSKVEVKKEE